MLKDRICLKNYVKTSNKDYKGVNSMVHKNPQNTEVDAYNYIKTELERLGWNVKNPARVIDGEVYKQNEALSNPDIKKCLDKDKPEAIIKLNEIDLWVIECKRNKSGINKALNEAKNQYAEKLNKSKKIKCILISGVAGNDIDGFTVQSEYLTDKGWEKVLFNNKPKDTLLSKEQAQYLIENKTPNWKEFPDFPEEKYLQSAEDINETLGAAGINKNKRARFIAGLILSLSTGSPIDLKTNDTKTLVNNINNLIDQKLREVNKENFSNYIKLEIPPSESNHDKYRLGIIDTLKELQTLDIKNAMASGNDVLGKFYEKFLKYGNGAKEIGIVLTPRHITNFAVEVLDVKYNDYVLDPTCGTGGFLVSALDYVKKNSNPEQTGSFKKYNLFGIEQDDDIVALALVNMIFRGDGRNNMSEGNCFQKNIVKTFYDDKETGKYVNIGGGGANNNPIITKVLMNPPFALKKGDEKEKHFIDYALSQMQDGELLFAVLPISVLIEKNTLEWRKDILLRNNTLLSVVTFPIDLFYPVSTHTVGIFVKKGVPHPQEQNVLWIRALNDGHLKKKGKRLESKKAKNDLLDITPILQSFIINQNILVENIPEIQKACKVDFNMTGFELIPEAYLDDRNPKYSEIIGEIEKLVTSTAGYLLTLSNKVITINPKETVDMTPKNFKMFPLTRICNIERKYAPYLNELVSDKEIVPYITTTQLNNGIANRYDADPNFYKDALTVSLDGTCGTTFYQFENFIAGEKTAVLTLKEEHDAHLLFYIGALIRIKSWRYHYGRKLSMTRLKEFEVPLPVKDGIDDNAEPTFDMIDLDTIKSVIENSYGWEIIDAYL